MGEGRGGRGGREGGRGGGAKEEGETSDYIRQPYMITRGLGR